MILEKSFQRYNFFRSPQWRWDRVVKICERIPTGRCSRHDDEFVKKARLFRQAWIERSEEDREELWRETPGIYYAYQYFMRETDDPRPVLCLQARLLSGQSFEAIATEMSTCAETVRWYEALFFNVVPYLSARDWITSRILIPAFTRHQHAIDDEGNPLPFKDSTVAKPFLDASLKMFAYFGGPLVVDFMLHGMQSGKLLTSSDKLTEWLDHHYSNTIRARSTQAAIQFEINKYNVLELFSVHSNLIALDRAQDSTNKKMTDMDQQIKALLDGIPWAVGSGGEQLYEGKLLGHFDKLPAELRTNEILKISAGDSVPELPADWPEKLPDPSIKESQVMKDDEALLS